jgi:hypothetical protein
MTVLVQVFLALFDSGKLREEEFRSTCLVNITISYPAQEKQVCAFVEYCRSAKILKEVSQQR